MQQDLNEPPKIPFLWINLNYRVNAELGRDVIVSGRKGTITKDMGTYIGVTWHDGNKKRSFPCHPTSEVIYLNTFTDSKKFKPSISAQRYQDYLEADCDLTFKEWLWTKNKK